MEPLKKTVRWLFDTPDENDVEDDGNTSEEEEEEAKSGPDSPSSARPKSILKEASVGEEKSRRRSMNRRSWGRQKKKNDDESPPKRASKRVSFGRKSKKEEEKHGSVSREGDKRSSWRRSWLRKNGDGGSPRSKPPSPRSEKRSSKRLSFGRSKKPAEKPTTLSNLGAIDEDGEYKQAKLEDSNIAGIGSEEDKSQRYSAARTEKHFKKVGKKVGVLVWRVENKRTKNDTPDFGINKWPKEEYGSFYSGDSYLVLNAYHPIDPLTKKKDKNKMKFDIHFWIGKESTQDEYGVVAYKAVELDDYINGKFGTDPVQHRETQFHESRLFLSYFKELSYLDGGIESGFRKVKPEEYEPRLLMVRHTKKTTKAFQIPVDSSKMNLGDCFLLDVGRVVYRYCGPEANVFELNKSGLLQHNICASRHGKAVKSDVDEEFWRIVGPEKNVKSAKEPYEPPASEQKLKSDELLAFRLSDATGTMVFSKEAEGKLTTGILDSDDVFLIHANVGIWVWIGNRATRREKQESMKYANDYLVQNKLPNTMTITCIPENETHSNALFQGLFTGSKSRRR